MRNLDPNVLAVLPAALCLMGALGVLLLRRWPNWREGASLLAAALAFGAVLAARSRWAEGEAAGLHLVSLFPGWAIAFRADALGLLFALVASGLWILNTLYSIGYVRAHREHKQTRYYVCFALSIAAALAGAFAANAFTLFLCYEALTLCTVPLVLHRETAAARAGARRYLSWLLGTSLAFQLPALLLLFHLAGTLTFQAGGILSAATASPALLSLLFVLYVAGLAKCALMPLHAWLPSAMVAPTPVSALLHAVAVVKMGVFSVARIVLDVFGTDLLATLGGGRIFLVAAAATIVMASLLALRQDDLKRRLAYSTVSQLSYVLLGLALLKPVAVFAGLLHVAVHAVAKITLFFGAGAIDVASQKQRVSELDGIGRRMPLTMAAFAIGVLSLIGLPPAAGMLTKWRLLQGGAQAEMPLLMGLLVLSALLNAAYFLPILWRAWARPDPSGAGRVAEAPWPCVVALLATGALTLYLFVDPEPIASLAREISGWGALR